MGHLPPLPDHLLSFELGPHGHRLHSGSPESRAWVDLGIDSVRDDARKQE